MQQNAETARMSDQGFDRFEPWAQSVSRYIGLLDLSSNAPGPFRARLSVARFGPGYLHRVQSSAHVARRTPEAIARSRRPAYYLVHVREGEMAVQAHGQQAAIGPGDLVLYDGKEEFSLAVTSPLDSCGLRLPQEWLNRHAPQIGASAGRRIDGSQGWGRALSAVFDNLSPDTVDDLMLPPAVIAEQVAALLVLATGGADAAHGGRQAPLLKRIRQALREMHDDPDLSPADVARAVGISKRYLHRVLAINGVTYGDELTFIRLQRAAELLRSRSHRGLSVQEIAYATGFADPSHFARKFRHCYGAPPRAWRSALAA